MTAASRRRRPDRTASSPGWCRATSSPTRSSPTTRTGSGRCSSVGEPGPLAGRQREDARGGAPLDLVVVIDIALTRRRGRPTTCSRRRRSWRSGSARSSTSSSRGTSSTSGARCSSRCPARCPSTRSTPACAVRSAPTPTRTSRRSPTPPRRGVRPTSTPSSASARHDPISASCSGCCCTKRSARR